jgi:hypothetical protein
MAIRMRGTGGLHSVRVIYEATTTLFWFDVDSSIPGWPQQQPAPAAAAAAAPSAMAPAAAGSKRDAGTLIAAVGEAAVLAAGSEAGEGVKRSRSDMLADVAGAGSGAHCAAGMVPATPGLPAWMQRPPFDPLAFQQRVHREMRQQGEQQGQQAEQGQQRKRQGLAAELLLDKKAEQWSRHHAAVVARDSQ